MKRFERSHGTCTQAKHHVVQLAAASRAKIQCHECTYCGTALAGPMCSQFRTTPVDPNA